MTAPRRLVLALLTAAVLLSGCAGAPDGAGTTSGGGTASPRTSAAPSPQPIAPFPMGPSTSTTPLPADLPQGCRDMLTTGVLSQLEGVPLNAEGMGGGIRDDSARVCVWGDPGAVATRLVTVVGYSPQREAEDALYALAGEGYTCYEPRGGTRCEKTWDHPSIPGVTEGRTLFYRDGVIVDTQYSNLAPSGYTDAIIDYLWPAVPRSPAAGPSGAPSPSETPTTTT